MADKLTALRIGVDDYLVKPFNEEELTLRIQYLLDNKENRVHKQIAVRKGEVNRDVDVEGAVSIELK